MDPSDPPAEDPLVGRTLGGHSCIEGVLGRGAMGVVHRARHTLLAQPFAVKVLPRDVAGS